MRALLAFAVLALAACSTAPQDEAPAPMPSMDF